VNASVPKTLVQHIIAWARDSGEWNGASAEAMDAILKTDISPELVPGDGGDEPHQKTEELIGPYALHDFFLYGVIRHGYSPRTLAWLARQSWGQGPDAMPTALIRATLKTFLTRFFSGSQFKRSCIANAPKVGSGGSLSPRGDWRMPSDSHAAVWLREFETIPWKD
jgi:NAD+ synthase (glutamine-hydrolysing)